MSPAAPGARDWSRFWTIAVLLFGAVTGYANLIESHWSAFVHPDWISANANKPPSWDFTNLWYGGRLVLTGEAATLFDPDAYRAGLRGMFAQTIDDSEWSYPPLALVYGVPLALLPVYPALLVWTAGTLALLIWTARLLGITGLAPLLLLLSPAVLLNALFGQNGALTTGLLLSGLYLSAARPVASGALLGLLGFKPQMGVLAPVALAAAGRWRAFLWAALALATVVAATLLLFGAGVWTGFLEVTSPLMRGIMEAPYGQPYHAHSVTVFALARAWGAGLGLAYGIQALSFAVCAALTVWAWRRPVDDALRCATVAPLLLLATPYSFAYDLVMVSVTALLLFQRAGHRFGLVTGLAWIWPAVNHHLAPNHMPLAPFVLAALAVVCLRECARSEARAP